MIDHTVNTKKVNHSTLETIKREKYFQPRISFSRIRLSNLIVIYLPLASRKDPPVGTTKHTSHIPMNDVSFLLLLSLNFHKTNGMIHIFTMSMSRHFFFLHIWSKDCGKGINIWAPYKSCYMDID